MKKILVLLFVILLAGCSGSSDLYLSRFTYDEYLNTVTDIKVYHNKKHDTDSKLYKAVDELLENTHGIFDAHSTSSELGILNETAHNEPVEVSDELYSVIKEALHYAEISDGAYDPTIGPLADLWGIDESSWLTGGVVPSDASIQNTLEDVDYTKVTLNESNQTVFFEKEDIKLDLGGIAKGYITELLKDLLIDKGIDHAVISVGSSSQLTIGTRVTQSGFDSSNEAIYIDEETPWRIGTRDPFDTIGFGGAIAAYTILDEAVSTSGSSIQFFEVDGVRYHHIFDTKTGYPVDNNLIAIQLKSDNIVGIDAVSTMLYVMGLEDGMEYVESNEGLEAIFITYDKEVYISSGFDGFELFDDEYEMKTMK